MQRYHSSLISYIKGRPDFRAKGLEREIERERERERERQRQRQGQRQRQRDRQTDREREEKEREREKEKEREKVRLLIETVLQYSLLMLSSRRGPSIDVLDNIRLIISTDDSVLCIFPTDAFI